MLRLAGLLAIVASALTLTATRTAAERPRLSVLFIVVDDLRPELAC